MRWAPAPARLWSPTLGVTVRVRLKHLGLMPDEAAELADVAVRTVHAVEAGKETMRLDAPLAIRDGGTSWPASYASANDA